MPLYHHSDVSVESWVEMAKDVSTRYEVDHTNDQATLFFGERDDYVLCLGRDTLGQVAKLAEKAHEELRDAALMEGVEDGVG
jgi:hypothetical protein